MIPTPTKAIMDRAKPRMTFCRIDRCVLEMSFAMIAVRWFLLNYFFL